MQSAFSTANSSSPDDRLEYLYLNLVGQLVMVHTVDGAVTEGLFLSRIDEDQHPADVNSPGQIGGIILRHHRRSQSPCYSVDEPADLTQGDLLICYADIVYMEVSNLRIRTSTPGSGQVEGFRGVHDLKQLDWTFQEELLEGEDGAHGADNDNGVWDQFKENKQKFGVGSTYSEEHYTTKLNRNEFTEEQRRYADTVAEEIMKSQAHGVAHMLDRAEIVEGDEGTLYSDVARVGTEEGSSAAGQRSGKPATKSNARGGGPAGAKGPSTSNGGAKGSRHEGREFNGAIPPAASDPGALGSGHSPSSPNDFNPQAQPFLPSRPAFDDFIKAVANAISKNEKDCFESPSGWPGDDQLAPPPINPVPNMNGSVPHGATMGGGGMHQGNNMQMTHDIVPYHANIGGGAHNMGSGPIPQTMPMIPYPGGNNPPGMMAPHPHPGGAGVGPGSAPHHPHAASQHSQVQQGGYHSVPAFHSMGQPMIPTGGNPTGPSGMYGVGRGANGHPYPPNSFSGMDMGFTGHNTPGGGASGAPMGGPMGGPMQNNNNNNTNNNNNNNNNNNGGSRGMPRQQKSTQPQQPVSVSSVSPTGMTHHNSPPNVGNTNNNNNNNNNTSSSQQHQHQVTIGSHAHGIHTSNNVAGSPPPGSTGGSSAGAAVLPNIDSSSLEKNANNNTNGNTNSSATHSAPTATTGPQRKMRRGGGVRDEKKGGK